MSYDSLSAPVMPNPRKPLWIRVCEFGVMAGPALGVAVGHRSFDAGLTRGFARDDLLPDVLQSDRIPDVARAGESAAVVVSSELGSRS